MPTIKPIRFYHPNPMRGLFLLSLLGVLLVWLPITGCKPKYQQQEKHTPTDYPDEEARIKANQSLIKRNAQLIKDQAKRSGWELIETGSGVFYQVFGLHKTGNPVKIRPGDRVSLSYKLSLLDGTECYSSKKQGLKQFIVEKSEAEPGLHEAIQYLVPGDSARIVIPPYRAFGLTGDGDRIPPGAILVYEVRVDSVSRHLNN